MDARPRSLTRRTLLAASATLTGLTALSACGARLEAPDDTGGPPEGDITLLTPIFDGQEGKQLLEQKLLPQFTAKYPLVKVSVDYLTGYDYLNEKITTGLTTGIPADVIMLGVGWVEPFASRQVLSELKPPPGGLTGYSDQILSACRWGGRLYALPVVLDTRFGICRTDLLAQAGLSQPPKSMGELRQYAITLTQRQDGKLTRTGLDVLSADPRQVFETVLFAFGGDLFRNGRPAFNDPTGVAALQWLADLQQRDKVIDAGFSNTKAVSVPIGDGRAAMCIGHNNWWVTTKKQHPESLPFLTPFLLNPAKPSIFAGGTLVTVSAASRHQSAAQALAAFIASPQVSLAGAQQKGNVPSLASLRDTEYVRNNRLVQFALDNLRYGRSEGGVGAWLTIRDDIKTAVQSAMNGRQTAQQALDQLAISAEIAIADFGQAN
ncbi:MAG: extracellular solute-binding protein [Pseudonocardiales bacterium]|nr:extracellular solute-binding protein [Pseudonocardiales bacterium]